VNSLIYKLAGCLTALLICFASPRSLWAIATGEIDTFTSTTEGWQQGQSSNLRATSGGPAGASDAYLRVVADGSSTLGKIVVFNTAQWAGNYTAAGIDAIAMAANNVGATSLTLRLAFGTTAAPDSGGTWFSSITGVTLPAASGWKNISFPIASTDLTRVSGTATYSTVMAGVVAVRLLHSSTASDRGQQVTATLGVDNITAISVAGDYNNNGLVDAADYVLWRGNQNTPLANDTTPLSVTQADYSLWRTRFAQNSGVGATANNVPEPPATTAMLLLYILTTGAAPLSKRLRRSRTTK
jgi:hypothetical protein